MLCRSRAAGVPAQPHAGRMRRGCAARGHRPPPSPCAPALPCPAPRLQVRSDFMTHSMQQQLALRNLQKEAMLMSKLRHPNGRCRGVGGSQGCSAQGTRRPCLPRLPARPRCPATRAQQVACLHAGSVTDPPPPPPPPPPPAVCLYLGAVTNPPCLVMEYCAKCSLDHLLRAGLTNQQVEAGCTRGRHGCHTELGPRPRAGSCGTAVQLPALQLPSLFHSFPRPSLTSLSPPWLRPTADGQAPHLGAPAQHGPGRSKRQAARPHRRGYAATCTGCMLCTLGGRRPDLVPGCDVAGMTWHAGVLSAVLPAAPPIPAGMLYLHSRNPPIAHRDLKSANLVRAPPCPPASRLALAPP